MSLKKEHLKTGLRWLLTIFVVSAGIKHFTDPGFFVPMVPTALPAPLTLVYVSGVAEIAGGLGLVLPQTRRLAAWGLIALFIAVFPANLNMAINHLPLDGKPVDPALLWARLPLQLVLIAWAYWFTRDQQPAAAAATTTARA